MGADYYIFSGYAAVFNNIDLGGDVLMPGAFRAGLLGRAARSIPMLWQHDTNNPIGVWDRIEEDARGLKVTGRLPDAVQRAREAAELIRIGGLSGLSIGYRIVRARRGMRQGRTVRFLDQVVLEEISPVTFPMNPQARVR